MLVDVGWEQSIAAGGRERPQQAESAPPAARGR